MILADTSVWVDFLHRGDDAFAYALAHELVMAHAWVIGELSLGNIPKRAQTMAMLNRLPRASAATSIEMTTLIEEHEVSGRGVGFVDVQLIASALIEGCSLWTHDKRMASVAADAGVAIHHGQTRPFSS